MFKEIVLQYSLTNLKGFKFIQITSKILNTQRRIKASTKFNLEVEEDKDITSADVQINEI